MSGLSTDRPCALYSAGKISIFVGGAYRVMTVEAAQRLQRELEAAIQASMQAGPRA